MYRTLIAPDELSSHLEAKNWIVVDCRFELHDTEAGRLAYEKSHIPNAIYAHLDNDLSGPIIPGQTGRHPLPNPEKAIELFSLWGISPSTQVIAYDDKGGGVASRLWWMLRWLGHDQVAVLDGGWQAWVAAGYPVSDLPASLTPYPFKAVLRQDLTAGTDQVDILRNQADYAVVDSRTAERYRGEVEPIDPVAGHIPGAVNLPFPDNMEQGRFLEPAALKARFEAAFGDKTPDKIIFYCGSGVTACHNVLAYAHAGLGDALLYPGSWSEWITDEDRPVAAG